jgi:hypothetical protein
MRAKRRADDQPSDRHTGPRAAIGLPFGFDEKP